MGQKFTNDDNPLVPKGWEYVYWPVAIMTPDWQDVGQAAAMHHDIRESVGHAFYMSAYSAMTDSIDTGFSMPNTAVYYVQNASTTTIYPTVQRVGGVFGKDFMNDPDNHYSVWGEYTWYPVPYFDQTTNLSAPDRNPAVAYQTTNQQWPGFPTNGYQYYVPQGPIECYFWNKAGQQEWASGCYGVVTCGVGGSYLELDILGKDGTALRTFGLNFGFIHTQETIKPDPNDSYTWYTRHYMDVDPATEQNIDFGVFTTTWVRPPYWDDYVAGVDGPNISVAYLGVPNNYYLRANADSNGNGGRGEGGGTIEFTYNGTCAGFRVRKATGLTPDDYYAASPRDFWVSGVGKKVPEVPPLRWNQRNDGKGIMDYSERISPTGSLSASSANKSNRLSIGKNVYE